MRAATNDVSAGASCTQRADGQVMFGPGSSAAGPVVSARRQFQTIVRRPTLLLRLGSVKDYAFRADGSKWPGPKVGYFVAKLAEGVSGMVGERRADDVDCGNARTGPWFRVMEVQIVENRGPLFLWATDSRFTPIGDRIRTCGWVLPASFDSQPVSAARCYPNRA